MIVVDDAQRKLDEAAAKYRRQYNRGFGLSERGFDVAAKALLDQANREYDAAKAAFAKARGTA